jgi:hypothetical protein
VSALRYVDLADIALTWLKRRGDLPEHATLDDAAARARAWAALEGTPSFQALGASLRLLPVPVEEDATVSGLVAAGRFTFRQGVLMRDQHLSDAVRIFNALETRVARSLALSAGFPVVPAAGTAGWAAPASAMPLAQLETREHRVLPIYGPTTDRSTWILNRVLIVFLRLRLALPILAGSIEEQVCPCAVGTKYGTCIDRFGIHAVHCKGVEGANLGVERTHRAVRDLLRDVQLEAGVQAKTEQSLIVGSGIIADTLARLSAQGRSLATDVSVVSPVAVKVLEASPATGTAISQSARRKASHYQPALDVRDDLDFVAAPIETTGLVGPTFLGLINRLALLAEERSGVSRAIYRTRWLHRFGVVVIRGVGSAVLDFIAWATRAVSSRLHSALAQGDDDGAGGAGDGAGGGADAAAAAAAAAAAGELIGDLIDVAELDLRAEDGDANVDDTSLRRAPD